MRAVFVQVLAVILLICSGVDSSVLRMAKPPSSLEPDVKLRTVRVSHRHQRVRKCVEEKNGGTCRAQLEDTDSATSITFDPSTESVSTVRVRQPIVVTFPHAVGRQEQITELGVGRWDVQRPDGRAFKTIDVGVTSEPTVTLRTISGRCDSVRRGCSLASEPVSRRLTVTEGGR